MRRLRWVLVAALVSACGRIGFDGLSGSGIDAGGDAGAGGDAVDIPLCLGPRTTVFGPSDYGLALGDLDGDGHLDLVIASYMGIATKLGDGQGNFGARASLMLSAGQTLVATAELTGDGNLDVAAVTGAANTVIVLPGDGTGGLAVGNTYALPGADFSGSVVAADLNHDGINDLVTAEYSSKQESVLIGTGGGSFNPPVNYLSSGEALEVATADLDHDGNLDLITGTAGGHGVSVRLGTGTGAFLADTDFAVGHTAMAVAISDFDQDGELDIAFANSLIPAFSVLDGNGDGSFQVARDMPSAALLQDIVAADFDADGYDDIAVAPTNKTVAFFHNNRDGTFTPGREWPLTEQPETLGALVVGALDAEPGLDLVVSHGPNYTFIGNGCTR